MSGHQSPDHPETGRGRDERDPVGLSAARRRAGRYVGTSRRPGTTRLALAVLVILLAGPRPAGAPATTEDDPLAKLVVAPEGPRDGYRRDLFPHWTDDDGDRCDTREEVLIVESRSTAQVDPYRCRVVEGDWLSVYDGVTTDRPEDLDVDHVVALAEAWYSGASGWDEARRRAFANDLDHPEALIAVTSSANRAKGDQDPAEWRPPRREAWCQYAHDWVTTKIAWDLSADQAEVEALRFLLDSCDDDGR